MINKTKLLNNIDNKNHKDDKLLYSKIIDDYNSCIKSFQPTFSDFIPIGKFMNLLEILRNNNEGFGLEYVIHGGFDEPERIIVGFFPEHISGSREEYISQIPLEIIEIKYNKKYSKLLTHRDFLGSIIGLGIDRSKIGDIILNNDKNICFIHKDIADYILFNLSKVGSTKVEVTKKDVNNIDININNLEEHKIIVSSLRLDATLSSAFNISRSKISSYIKSNKVFLNYIECDNISKIIKFGDIITIRGLGRIKIGEVLGSTKKERIVLEIYKYK